MALILLGGVAVPWVATTATAGPRLSPRARAAPKPKAPALVYHARLNTSHGCSRTSVHDVTDVTITLRWRGHRAWLSLVKRSLLEVRTRTRFRSPLRLTRRTRVHWDLAWRGTVTPSGRTHPGPFKLRLKLVKRACHQTRLGGTRKAASPPRKSPKRLKLTCRRQKIQVRKAGAPHSSAALWPHFVAKNEPAPVQHRALRCTAQGPVPTIMKKTMFHDALAFDPKGRLRLHRGQLLLRNRKLDTRNGVLRLR